MGNGRISVDHKSQEGRNPGPGLIVAIEVSKVLQPINLGGLTYVERGRDICQSVSLREAEMQAGHWWTRLFRRCP